MTSERREFHERRVKYRIEMPLRELGAQVFLAAAITRVENRTEHPDPVFGKQLLQYGMVVSADTEEKSKWLASVSNDPEWRWCR